MKTGLTGQIKKGWYKRYVLRRLPHRIGPNANPDAPIPTSSYEYKSLRVNRYGLFAF